MKTSKHKVYKSNFIFSIIAKDLSATHESYYKWYLAGAINGISLGLSNGTYIEVYCFEIPNLNNDSDENCTTVKFEDILISFFTNGNAKIIVESIKKAERLFNQLPIEEQKYEQIRKLHFSFIIAPDENQYKLKDNVIQDLSDILNPDRLEESDLSISPFDENKYEFELSFYFSGVIEDQLLKLLKPYFFTIKSPLLQHGFVCINHTVSDSLEKEIHWCHITARQF